MNLRAQRNLPSANPQSPSVNGPIDKEMEIGTKVEMEHTSDPALAMKISADHLREDPHYYSKLMAAGLVDEPEAQEMVAQSGNTAPHVETKPLAPAPKSSPRGNFVDAERKTRPLGSDNLEHYAAHISKVLAVDLSNFIPNSIEMPCCEGGSTITEPNAGITSDQNGNRWSIDAYPDDKKITPPME